MYQGQDLHRVSAFNNTSDVDLTCALANYFNVDVPLRECGEHSPGDPDHIARLLPTRERIATSRCMEIWKERSNEKKRTALQRGNVQFRSSASRR